MNICKESLPIISAVEMLATVYGCKSVSTFNKLHELESQLFNFLGHQFTNR